MKKYIKIGVLACFMGLTACQEGAKQFESVNAKDFAEIIAQQETQLLDVRTAEEYAKGHIANSMNIDVTQDDFVTKAKQALNKEQTVALYCRSGRRSKQAAEMLSQEGFKIVELNGGYKEWTNNK